MLNRDSVYGARACPRAPEAPFWRRRRPWGRVLAVVLLALGACLVVASPAAAGGGGCPDVPGVDLPPDDCAVWDDDTTGGPGGPGRNGGPRRCTDLDGSTIPCTDPDLGWWFPPGRCYAKPLQPQPPASSGHWPNNDTSVGLVYSIVCVDIDDSGAMTGWGEIRWIEDGPVPNPAELARRALAKITLKGALIGIAPDPAGAGLVGLPVWMWTAVTPNTWGPITSSDSDMGLTVTITGKAQYIRWDMGDGGEPEICRVPGTPYESSYGAQPSPDCGHIYQRSSRNATGGRYTITATTYWHIEWEAIGLRGDIDLQRTSTTTIRIDELQVVIT